MTDTDILAGLRAMIVAVVRDELGKSAPTVEHLTVADYARRWSISPSTVRVAIREGRLPSTRIGRAIRIAAEAKISRSSTKTSTDRARLRLMGGTVR